MSQEKTNIFFSMNVDWGMCERLVQICGFRVTHSLRKYLGLLLTWKTSRRDDYHYLIEKVRAKLSSLKAD